MSINDRIGQDLFIWPIHDVTTRSLIDNIQQQLISIHNDHTTPTSTFVHSKKVLEQSGLFRSALNRFLVQSRQNYITYLDYESSQTGDHIPPTNRRQRRRQQLYLPRSLQTLKQHQISSEDYLEYIQHIEVLSTLYHFFELFHLDPYENITAQLSSWFHQHNDLPQYFFDIFRSTTVLEQLTLAASESALANRDLTWFGRHTPWFSVLTHVIPSNTRSNTSTTILTSAQMPQITSALTSSLTTAHDTTTTTATETASISSSTSSLLTSFATPNISTLPSSSSHLHSPQLPQSAQLTTHSGTTNLFQQQQQFSTQNNTLSSGIPLPFLFDVNNDQYWLLCIQMVLQGRVIEFLQLININSHLHPESPIAGISYEQLVLFPLLLCPSLSADLLTVLQDQTHIRNSCCLLGALDICTNVSHQPDELPTIGRTKLQRRRRQTKKITAHQNTEQDDEDNVHTSPNPHQQYTTIATTPPFSQLTVEQRFASWQQQVAHIIRLAVSNDVTFTAHPIYRILSILSGDVDIIEQMTYEIANCCIESLVQPELEKEDITHAQRAAMESFIVTSDPSFVWLQLTLSSMLYVEPFATKERVGLLLQDAFNAVLHYYYHVERNTTFIAQLESDMISDCFLSFATQSVISCINIFTTIISQQTYDTLHILHHEQSDYDLEHTAQTDTATQLVPSSGDSSTVQQSWRFNNKAITIYGCDWLNAMVLEFIFIASKGAAAISASLLNETSAEMDEQRQQQPQQPVRGVQNDPLLFAPTDFIHRHRSTAQQAASTAATAPNNTSVAPFDSFAPYILPFPLPNTLLQRERLVSSRRASLEQRSQALSQVIPHIDLRQRSLLQFLDVIVSGLYRSPSFRSLLFTSMQQERDFFTKYETLLTEYALEQDSYQDAEQLDDVKTKQQQNPHIIASQQLQDPALYSQMLVDYNNALHYNIIHAWATHYYDIVPHVDLVSNNFAQLVQLYQLASSSVYLAVPFQPFSKVSSSSSSSSTASSSRISVCQQHLILLCSAFFTSHFDSVTLRPHADNFYKRNTSLVKTNYPMLSWDQLTATMTQIFLAAPLSSTTRSLAPLPHSTSHNFSRIIQHYAIYFFTSRLIHLCCIEALTNPLALAGQNETASSTSSSSTKTTTATAAAARSSSQFDSSHRPSSLISHPGLLIMINVLISHVNSSFAQLLCLPPLPALNPIRLIPSLSLQDVISTQSVQVLPRLSSSSTQKQTSPPRHLVELFPTLFASPLSPQQLLPTILSLVLELNCTPLSQAFFHVILQSCFSNDNLVRVYYRQGLQRFAQGSSPIASIQHCLRLVSNAQQQTPSITSVESTSIKRSRHTNVTSKPTCSPSLSFFYYDPLSTTSTSSTSPASLSSTHPVSLLQPWTISLNHNVFARAVLDIRGKSTTSSIPLHSTPVVLIWTRYVSSLLEVSVPNLIHASSLLTALWSIEAFASSLYLLSYTHAISALTSPQTHALTLEQQRHEEQKRFEKQQEKERVAQDELRRQAAETHLQQQQQQREQQFGNPFRQPYHSRQQQQQQQRAESGISFASAAAAAISNYDHVKKRSLFEDSDSPTSSFSSSQDSSLFASPYSDSYATSLVPPGIITDSPSSHNIHHVVHLGNSGELGTSPSDANPSQLSSSSSSSSASSSSSSSSANSSDQASSSAVSYQEYIERINQTLYAFAPVEDFLALPWHSVPTSDVLSSPSSSQYLVLVSTSPLSSPSLTKRSESSQLSPTTSKLLANITTFCTDRSTIQLAYLTQLLFSTSQLLTAALLPSLPTRFHSTIILQWCGLFTVMQDGYTLVSANQILHQRTQEMSQDATTTDFVMSKTTDDVSELNAHLPLQFQPNAWINPSAVYNDSEQDTDSIVSIGSNQDARDCVLPPISCLPHRYRDIYSSVLHHRACYTLPRLSPLAPQSTTQQNDALHFFLVKAQTQPQIFTILSDFRTALQHSIHVTIAHNSLEYRLFNTPRFLLDSFVNSDLYFDMISANINATQNPVQQPDTELPPHHAFAPDMSIQPGLFDESFTSNDQATTSATSPDADVLAELLQLPVYALYSNSFNSSLIFGTVSAQISQALSRHQNTPLSLSPFQQSDMAHRVLFDDINKRLDFFGAPTSAI